MTDDANDLLVQHPFLKDANTEDQAPRLRWNAIKMDAPGPEEKCHQK